MLYYIFSIKSTCKYLNKKMNLHENVNFEITVEEIALRW